MCTLPLRASLQVPHSMLLGVRLQAQLNAAVSKQQPIIL
jgi:hypothetical protein